MVALTFDRKGFIKIPLIGRVAKLAQTLVVHKQEVRPGKEQRKEHQSPNIKVSRAQGKTQNLKMECREKPGNWEAQHPVQIWKSLIGTSNFLQVDNKSHVHVDASSSKKATKPFIGSPERGFGNISKSLSKIKSSKIPSATNGSGSGLPEINALLFPCLAIGFTAW